MDDQIIKNLKQARIQVSGHYCDGSDISLEIPAFYVPPENYNDFGLSILNPWESSLKYIHIIQPREIEKNYIRLRIGERVGQFNLTDDDFKVQIVNFIYP